MAIKPATVERDKDGFWSHPELPYWDESTTAAELAQWNEENSVDIEIIRLENDAPEELAEAWYEGDTSDCSEWDPKCSREGSFLLSIHDSEEGPVAIFAVPKAGESCQQ